MYSLGNVEWNFKEHQDRRSQQWCTILYHGYPYFEGDWNLVESCRSSELLKEKAQFGRFFSLNSLWLFFICSYALLIKEDNNLSLRLHSIA